MFSMQGDLGGFATNAPEDFYEFSEVENQTIGRTGGRAQAWGLASVVLGVAVIIGGVVAMALGGKFGLAAGIAMIVAIIPTIVSGLFYKKAGDSFKAVVSTKGHDVPLVMQAIDDLTLAVKIEAIASIVGFVLGLVLGVALIASIGARL